MKCTVTHGDALQEPGDVLICSANVWLNLSGGVGGEILRRHGDAMQKSLHSELTRRGVKHVAQGDVVETAGYGTGFKHVLHAVAVDGWYQSSIEIIAAVIGRSLSRAEELGAKKVVLVALATGFGRMKMTDFGTGLVRANVEKYLGIEEIVVCVSKPEHAAELSSLL